MFSFVFGDVIETSNMTRVINGRRVTSNSYILGIIFLLFLLLSLFLSSSLLPSFFPHFSPPLHLLFLFCVHFDTIKVEK